MAVRVLRFHRKKRGLKIGVIGLERQGTMGIGLSCVLRNPCQQGKWNSIFGKLWLPENVMARTVNRAARGAQGLQRNQG
jgi:hypothetical protein